MFPGFTKYNASDSCNVYPVLAGQRRATNTCGVCPTNCTYFAACQFGEVLAFAHRSTSLRGSIGHVGTLSSWEQMSRIATRRVIAFMQNVYTRRYRAVHQFIHKTVRSSQPSTPSEYSIPIIVKRTMPQPTSIWPATSINVGPELRNPLFVSILTGHCANLHNRLVDVMPKDVPASLRLSHVYYTT